MAKPTPCVARPDDVLPHIPQRMIRKDSPSDLAVGDGHPGRPGAREVLAATARGILVPDVDAAPGSVAQGAPPVAVGSDLGEHRNEVMALRRALG